MYTVSVKDIINNTEGKLIRGKDSDEIKRFSIDSRTISSGDIFIAIKGARFDGHRFVRQAVAKGAQGIIIEEGIELLLTPPEIIIQVKDTIKALGAIASIVRAKFPGPVVAITGSVGKTSTKEIIATVLKQKLKTHKTFGTLNNHIGVPLSLLGLDPMYDISVLELGMSCLGEIKYLSKISRPDVGIITNIGPAHLQGLSNIETIIEAKAELLDAMGENGLTILNRDDSSFAKLQEKVKNRLITIGKDQRADFQAVGSWTNKQGNIHFRILAKPFNDILEGILPVIGIHNLYSALFAVVLGYGAGLRPAEIIAGLAKIELPRRRLELKEVAGIKILDDCYNANPLSMLSALETLAMLQGKQRKIFVCGDMLELGDKAAIYHQELGEQLINFEIDKLITVGHLSQLVSETALKCGKEKGSVRHCQDNMEAVTVLSEWLEPGDMVLVKGSHSNHMEEISKGIEEYYGTLDKLIV